MPFLFKFCETKFKKLYPNILSNKTRSKFFFMFDKCKLYMSSIQEKTKKIRFFLY